MFTIGHSTRTLAELVAILKSHLVSVLADVRTVPRSRHVPQFNSESLAGDLAKSGIEYIALSALGGVLSLDREATMKRSVKKQRRSGSGTPFVRGPFDLGVVPRAGKIHRMGSTRRGGGRIGRALQAHASEPPAPTAKALARWENEGGSPAPRPTSDRDRKTKATHAPKKSLVKHSTKKSNPRPR
jgi:hypothetical protein